MSAAWEPVIGLEIHTQLATVSKIFSGSATAYGAEPNTQASLIDLGYPGVLPVLNKEVVRMACMFGLAVGATVAERSVFARKNYFYPDLPKGYQISQYELPIVEHGALVITGDDGEPKRIGITRAHLEEDAGKSVHEGLGDYSGIDLNRAGTPLLEIVSEPDLRSAKEAVAYMRKIHTIVRYLGISDGNMQEGSFRCDANVSVRPRGQEALGIRAELKNLNSFRFVEKAINFEIERQIDVLEDGGEVVQETRLYDSDSDETRSMRSKEEANDYRYFPDPDLLPVEIDAAYVDAVRQSLPELPDAKQSRFVADYSVREADADILTSSRPLADYFETVVAKTTGEPQVAANWILGDLSGALNRDGLAIEECRIAPEALAALIDRIEDQTISGKIAKDVFDAMWNGEGDADAIIDARGLKQITDASAIDAIVDAVIAANPSQVAEYRDGKEKLMGYFVGQVMKETGGKANPGAGQSSTETKACSALTTMTRDVVLPFVFEHIPVRGAVVQLSDTWVDLKQHQNYTPAVSATLGEAAAATTLIAQSLKSESSVTLQISGKGPLSMLVMQVTSALEVRGLASEKPAAAGLAFPELVRDGHCAITVDNATSEQPYQGIVDVTGDSLAACLETYFARSAQIPSHLTLRASAETCGGILLQQMPGRDDASEDDWRRLGLLAETLNADELAAGVEASLLGRLFAADDVRVFRGRETAFRCRCSRARAANVLKLLGADDCRRASEDQGAVVVTCEYCGRRQSFDAIDIAEIFADVSASPSDSVH